MIDDVIANLLLDITDPSSSKMRAEALRGTGVQQPPEPEPPPMDPTQFGGMQQPAPDTGMMDMPFDQPAAPQQPAPMGPQQPPPGFGPQGPSAAPPGMGAAPPPQNAPQGPAGPAAGAPGGGGLPMAAGRMPSYGGGDNLMAQFDDIQRRRAEAEAEEQAAYQPVDRGDSEREYQERVAQAPQNMALSIAAGEAGEQFQPWKAHFLKQAAEMGGPMKMAGGTMTPTGFIEDPGYKQELAVKRSTAKINALDKALATNITLQERRRLENEARQERILRANIAAGAKRDAAANAPGKILPVKTVGDITDDVNKLRTIDRLSKEFKPEYAGLGGMAMDYAGRIPGVSTQSREWWRNYKRESELIERHGLFGASLTEGESAAWRSADINPGMDPMDVQANLQRRQQIITDHYNEYVRGLQKSGYNTSAFGEMEGGSTPGSSPGTSASGGVTVRVNSDADYNALAPGTLFVGPDGQPRRKP